MKNVMTRAWEIARNAVEKFGGKVKEFFASSLKLAWAESKQVSVSPTTEEENVMQVIEIVREFENGSKTVVTEVVCTRCGGKGNFAHMSHINKGECFKCNGTGLTPKTVKVSADTKINIVLPSTEKKPSQATMAVRHENEMLARRLREIEMERINDLKAFHKRREEEKAREEEIKKNPIVFDWDDIFS